MIKSDLVQMINVHYTVSSGELILQMVDYCESTSYMLNNNPVQHYNDIMLIDSFLQDA